MLLDMIQNCVTDQRLTSDNTQVEAESSSSQCSNRGRETGQGQPATYMQGSEQVEHLVSVRISVSDERFSVSWIFQV